MAEWTDILLVLLLGGVSAWLSQRFRLPNAVLQVLLGVVLGAAVLGWVPHSPLLHVFGEIGVLLLLGTAGLALGIRRLQAAGWAGVAVATLGILFGVSGGYAVGWFFGSPSEEALYLGLALGATSIGITVQVLEQFGLIGHRIADILIAAAVLDDVIVLYLLGATHGLLQGDASVIAALTFVLLAVISLGGVFAVFRMLTQWALSKTLIDSKLRRGLWIIAAIGLGATLTQALGMSAVVGAFFAGVGVGEGLDDEARDISTKSLRPLVLMFMPFFFVMIGVQANWDIARDPALLGFVIALTAIAVAAKVGGGIVGTRRALSWRERWAVGFGMAARGEVCLVIATVGLKQGHITQATFAALVLTAILLSILGPGLMTPFAKRLAAESL